MEKEFYFSALQWVLVRNGYDDKWTLGQFSHYEKDKVFPYILSGGNSYKYCIPYKGNKHLRGTADANIIKPYIPKDGDFVFIKMRYVDGSTSSFIYIQKGNDGSHYNYYLYYSTSTRWINKEGMVEFHFKFDVEEKRAATEEEKNKLISKLREQGDDWDYDKKCTISYIIKPYIAKDGEFVYCESYNGRNFIFIKKDGEFLTDAYVAYNINGDGSIWYKIACIFDNEIKIIRPATEKEKNKLILMLHEYGEDWNEEKKEIVSWNWKPELGDPYYFVALYNCSFITSSSIWRKSITEFELLDKGWVFNLKEKCDAMCDRLNNAIKDIKL